MKNFKIAAIILAAVLLTAALTSSFAPSLGWGAMGQPGGDDTVVVASGADTVHMSINGQSKGPLKNKNFLRIAVYVTKVDSVKTNTGYLEGSLTGKDGEWFRINASTDSTVFTNTAGTKGYTLIYSPVTWKYHRYTVALNGPQKFTIVGTYDNQ